jgi:Protein of unknown function (DUF3489)
MTTSKRTSKSKNAKPSRTARASSKKQVIAASKTKTFASRAKPANLPGVKVSKKELVLGMLRGTDGASIAAIMAATDWQEHSVRGFFAAVVKKKLKLNLVSQKVGDDRVYRIETIDSVA